LITGGSSGSGPMIAEELAASGMRVSLAVREPARAGLSAVHLISMDLADMLLELSPQTFVPELALDRLGSVGAHLRR
jgi:NAD(P)-dependent dehydrogenase (short-subunit alcohol dehydrogenase family)